LAAPQAVIELVERFDRNVESYRSGQYNETQLRREFIDPLFKALGWDVDNEKGYAEAYKDVVHEDAIKVGSSTKAPDYSFRIGGTRKFFVEAKKPSVNLKDDISPAFQLRRYSWSAKLPLGILTDFEELAVYDGRVQPVKNDKASKARVKYFTYKEYVDRWDEIATVFSHEEVLKGSFDKYVESSKAKRGTAEVDAAFLKEIEAWRDMLARNIALRNPDLTTRELNFAVQRTIDRIVFLRICEDRGIEKYGWLQSLLQGQRVYLRLCEFFHRADERYNSGLFHFHEDPARQEPPDELTLSLEIDDKILKDIIRDLYYPDSPYEFSVLPPEILGHVYEQFLGKVISLTSGHRAKVEYKPEIRKAGGVYYTPSYIVNYIVENTIGKLLEGQTPAAASELRVLDPACGSGSFLIGAYQGLLDWHRDWYVEKLVPLLEAGQNAASKEVQALLPEGYTTPKRRGKKRNQSNNNHFPIFQAQGGEWKLTTEERKRILLNNIYGVDIDPQAVEVTKLSLHLKILEGESEETLSKQLKLFQERALPDLGQNIKCGNSLIGWDILEGRPEMTEEEIDRINPFDWDGEFPEIMSRGGFDVVIGNPPYVRQEELGELKGYFQKHYEVYHGIADLYAYFVERGVSLLQRRGIFSYIVANKWMRANYGKPLRSWLKEQRIEEIIDFGDLPVFKGASAYPCIMRIVKEDPKDSFKVAQLKHLSHQDLNEYVRKNYYYVNLLDLEDKGWSLTDNQTKALLAKLISIGKPLGEHLHGKIHNGIKTGLNKAFIIDSEIKEQLISEDPRSEEVIKPFLLGKDIKRYLPPKSNYYLIYIPWHFPLHYNQEIVTASSKAEAQFERDYPAIYRHLLKFKPQLTKRDRAETNIKYEWYALQRPRADHLDEFEIPKIIYPNICKRPEFSLDEMKSYANQKCFIIPCYDKYLLSILNSSISFFFFRLILPKLRGEFYEPGRVYLKDFPIRTIDFSDPLDVARHDQMVGLVDRLLDLHKRLAETKAGHEKTLLQRQIEATDKQIDRLVYELYGLTEGEIRIVEEATA